jgi:hypothetical protein
MKAISVAPSDTQVCPMCLAPGSDGRICRRCRSVLRSFRIAGAEPPGRLDRREYWLPVAGHENCYEVSSFGRVRSLARFIDTTRGRRFIPAKILSPFGRPYPCVSLPGRGTVAAHVLVAEAFLGPRPPGALVLHAHDDPADAWLGHLDYGSRSDNAHDAVRNGVRKRLCPSGRHRLTGGDLLITSDGTRRCVACLRERADTARDPSRPNRDDNC